MTWFYQDKVFTEQDIGDYKGFVYLITDLETEMKYVGQKVFWNKVSKPPLKGKTRRRISKKQSNWQDYYGSNDQLISEVAENSADRYRREILRLCKSKAEQNYYELYEIVSRHALLDETYYNSWVSTRINRNQLKPLIK